VKGKATVSAVLALTALSALFAGYLVLFRKGNPSSFEGASPPSRIVSMVPSLTEVLFALGVGDRVVGVTDWCKWPPEARRKRHMGGYTDPNYEAIAAAGPDLVLTMPEQTEFRKSLEKLGMRTVSIGQRNIGEILNSIMAVGRTCGAEERARKLVSELKARMRAVAAKVRKLPRPRVLVCVDRSPAGAGRIENLYAAGGRGFYDELITRSGGINACDVTAVDYPCLSKEGLIGMNPDIIIANSFPVSKSAGSRRRKRLRIGTSFRCSGR